MKVLLVIGTLERGGSERQVVELVRAVHPRYAHCVVVCLGNGGPLASEIESVGASVLTLGARRLYSPRALARLAWVLRRERPDVLYAFLFWGYGISLPLAALLTPATCRIQARRALPDMDIPNRTIFRGLRLIADRCTHGVIVNSLAVGAAVARNEPTIAGHIWVVPNGVGRVERPPLSPPHTSEVRIVCVANLIAYKGHATLIAALSRLRRSDWTVMLAGDGPERAIVERMIAARDLQAIVRVLGSCSDVAELLGIADIVVLPSYTEGMPNAVLEAMACGIPVVASDVGGVRSLLGSGAGIIVPPRDEVALAHALQRLIDDPALREDMGRIGRQLAREALSIEIMRDATLRAFGEIEERRRRSSWTCSARDLNRAGTP